MASMSNHATSAAVSPQRHEESEIDDGPLSWDVARSRLRSVLEGYLDEVSSHTSSSSTSSTSSSATRAARDNAASDASKSTTDEALSPENSGTKLNGQGGLESHDSAANGGRRLLSSDRDPPPLIVDETASVHHQPEAGVTTQPSTFMGNSLSWWIRNDLDMYLGALVLSLALLVLAVFSLTAAAKPPSAASPLHPKAGPAVYRAQVAAASLLTAGSLVSLWLIRRQKHLTSSDSDSAKRREVLRFLRKFDAETLQQQEQSTGADVEMSSKGSHRNRLGSDASHPVRASARGLSDVDMPGTSLTDIYPVFRTNVTSPTSTAASWCRIPSLLLAKGDWVALQVGDTVPADCELVVDLGQRNASGNKPVPTTLRRGRTVTLESLSTKQEGKTSVLPFGKGDMGLPAALPNSRVTLPAASSHLLTLCNQMKIYRVLEPPLRDFIRRPAASSRPSLMARKMLEIRKALALLSAAFLLATAILVLARPGITSTDLSLILPLPLLAALGVSPVVGPAFVFALEMLGTARILHRVHPHAAIERPDPHGAASNFTLLVRYVVATLLTRLSLWEAARRWYEFRVWLGLTPRRASFRHPLVRVPPASLNLLEKLGVATALALVDDELACDPHAMPQQLLIPSSKGLKLLDLCPTYEDDDNTDNSDGDDSHRSATEHSRRRGLSMGDSDDDSSEEGTTVQHYSALRRKFLIRRRHPKRRRKRSNQDDETDASDESSIDVQFEDPTWWQHLPSLKCIGLAGLLIDDASDDKLKNSSGDRTISHNSKHDEDVLSTASSSLISLLCSERGNHPYRTLSECIGFSTDPNSFGDRGDLSPFSERVRLQVLSQSLFRERLERDSHQRSSEEARWWGHLRPDATSVVVQDSRSGAYQLLTVGDPSVVLSLCNEAWQGEISTIIPLGADTRRTLLETSNSWKLGDLDVAAFSYSPLSLALEQKIVGDGTLPPRRYLLDNSSDLSSATTRDKLASQEWSSIRNQVFLGILGSLLVPRREITDLLRVLNESGVRFTYFSPRNMRRQKELASQMGIDVAWNCAISLRPLESGAEDEYRMVSNYADWDVNARLPHGISDVRQHLKEVDNVPLLVSLFTDVTKTTTREMVEIFQEYNDTVIVIGISHLPRNDSIFSTADIAVGIDTLSDATHEASASHTSNRRHVRVSELEFVSAIASHSCAFRFHGASSIANIPSILSTSRAALEAASAAGVFVAASCVAFSVFVLMCSCTVATAIVAVPTLGSVLFLQLLVPLMGFAIAMSDAEPDCMKRVPPKNDLKVTFSRQEGWRLYGAVIAKAIPTAAFPQFLYLIALGQFMLYLEPELVADACPGASTWAQVIRCTELRSYSGAARTGAGAMTIAHFALNVMIGSASFVSRFSPIVELAPWQHNDAWLWACGLSIALVAVYLAVTVPTGAAMSLPWYYYVYAVVTPFLCAIWNEYWKSKEAWHDRRAEKLRRLQFETRLGAWSPK